MKQLETLINAMKVKKTVAMTVVDLADGAEVYKNATVAKLTADYGSIENFFETLYKNGMKSLRIFERRSNGSNFIPFGVPFDIDMESKVESESVIENKPTAVQPKMTMHDQPQAIALNGGLNAVQVYHAQDYPRLQGEHSAYKLEVENLKQQLLEKKEEILELKYSEKKELGKQDMMGSLAGHIPGIMTGLAALGVTIGKKGVAQAGLAGPDELSPAQTEVFEIMKRLDPDTLYTFGEMANSLQNPEFVAELMELLKKFDVVPAA